MTVSFKRSLVLLLKNDAEGNYGDGTSIKSQPALPGDPDLTSPYIAALPTVTIVPGDPALFIELHSHRALTCRQNTLIYKVENEIEP